MPSPKITIEQQKILDHLAKLRAEKKTAGAERGIEILKEVQDLIKFHGLKQCRQCLRYGFINENDPDYPFCSSKCHTLWADTNYNRPEDQNGIRRYKTIDACQRRIEEIKAEIRIGRQRPLLPSDTAAAVSP